MKTVTDETGRVWKLQYTLDDAMQLDQSDFSALTDKKLRFLRLDEETMTVIATTKAILPWMFYIILKDQVKANLGIDPEVEPEKAQRAFLKVFTGAVVQAAVTPFLECLDDFFPEQKTVLSTLLEQRKVALATMQAGLVKMAPKFEKELGRVVGNMMISLDRDLPKMLDDAIGEKSSE